MRVTFNAEWQQRLVAQQELFPEAQAQLREEFAAGYEVTGHPKPGLVNVTIMRKGLANYRTFPARRLVEVTA
jgi:hypothetical protein